MIQQKQQNSQQGKKKYSLKRRSKIGFLVNKNQLPQINRSISRRSQNPQQVKSSRKHKLPQIFYEQPNAQKQQKNQSSLPKMPQKYCKISQKQNEEKLQLKFFDQPDEHHMIKKLNQHTQFLFSRIKSQSSTSQSRVVQSLETFKKRKLISQPIKLKSLKINNYQKLQYFDTPKNILPRQSRIQTLKGFLTIDQTKQITQRLSKPKCLQKCQKKNCQCYLKRQIKSKKKRYRKKNQQAPNASNLKKYIGAIDSRELDISSNLRKIKRQKKAEKKKYILTPLNKYQNYDDDHVSECSSLKQKKSNRYQEQYLEQENDFIKGIMKNSKNKYEDEEIQDQSRVTVQIQTQYQNQDLYRQQNVQTKIQVKISKKNTSRKNKVDQKVQTIGYTFANQPHLIENINQEKQKSSIKQNKKNQQINIKDRKNPKYFQFIRLDGHYYDVYNKKLIEVIANQNKSTKLSKFSIQKQVINEKITNSYNQNKKSQLNLFFQVGKVSLNTSPGYNKPQESLIPIDRNCISSTSQMKQINMFNRQLGMKQSRVSKKIFDIPKQSQCAQFIQNYNQVNPNINIKKMFKKENFKVIPTSTCLYFGQYEQQKKNGLGIQVQHNQIFQGLFQNDQRIQGYLKLQNGVYEGEFKNKLRHGQGTFKWNNGQTYTGEWKAGSKNGYGIWKSIDGSLYQGQWKMNQQHGKGKHVHPSSIYQGQFIQSLKNGMGTQTFPNGDVFHGFYKQGKPNGPGKYMWADGTYYQGNFKNGLRQGFAKWHQSCDSFYEGFFSNDQKNGKGTQYFKDGSYLQAQYLNGTLMSGKIYDKNQVFIQNVNSSLIPNNK